MKTKPILVLRKRLVWRVLAIACLVLLTGIATLAVQTTSAPKAHAMHADNPLNPPAQLIFLDYRSDIYSIRVSGPNQNGTWTDSPCWQTPGFESVFHNWWWASTTYVYLYLDSNCSNYFGYLTLNPDSGTGYQCLMDTPPYSDYPCTP